MKKFVLTFTALLGIAPFLAAKDLAEVVHIPHDKVQAALDNKADIYLLKADNVIVEGNYRNKAGGPEVHTMLTDTFLIMEGSATLLAGGTLEGGKPIAPGQIRGGKIVGGTNYHLEKGDSIVIPAGIPHQFSEVPTVVKYYTVKVIKQQ
ncbi:MAG TPA: hypothetical protein VG892_07385 [Terriglobales bacterium]|jgi:mannose-6-phosphate isomerase-like protein (cupin superfamily)|nr:hypothetical protein [Terriglobales bacterium]